MKIAAILTGFLVALVLFRPADSYQVTGMKYDHLAITYSCGDGTLRDAVKMWADVSGLQDGGCSQTPDIVLYLPSTWPYDPNAIGWAAYSSTDGHTIRQCTLAIRPDSVGYIGVYLHEVGHCLGSSHSEVSESAMWPYCCHWLAPDDIAMVQSLYGTNEAQTQTAETAFRAAIPMLAAD